MKKIKLPIGHIAYEATASEATNLGGLGICDDCGKHAYHGYLVPVLNHYQCPECFKDWSSRAKYYPEDVPFEQEVAKYYESRIPLTEGDPDD